MLALHVFYVDCGLPNSSEMTEEHFFRNWKWAGSIYFKIKANGLKEIAETKTVFAKYLIGPLSQTEPILGAFFHESGLLETQVKSLTINFRVARIWPKSIVHRELQITKFVLRDDH